MKFGWTSPHHFSHSGKLRFAGSLPFGVKDTNKPPLRNKTSAKRNTFDGDGTCSRTCEEKKQSKVPTSLGSLTASSMSATVGTESFSSAYFLRVGAISNART